MADNKKSFVLYTDLLGMVEKLPNEKAGELFKIILEYVNDRHPQIDDLLLQIAFEPIKAQLKRDLESWDKTIKYKSVNGRIGNLKRWNIDLYNQVKDEELSLDEAENIANNRKTSLSDGNDTCATNNIAPIAVNDNVTVTVNDSVTDTENKKIDSSFNFKKSFLDLGVENAIISDWLKVRKTKKASNTETAFNAIKNQIELSGLSANKCIEMAVIKNWSGFNSSWIKDDEKPKQPKSNVVRPIDYLIPKDDYFGYDNAVLIQRCVDGCYKKKEI